jgi:hypothetical protein
VFECLLGGRLVEHLLEDLALPCLRHRKITQRVEVGGSRGLHPLDDCLELGAGWLGFLLESKVVFVNVPDKRLPIPQVLLPLRYAATSPGSVGYQRPKWHGFCKLSFAKWTNSFFPFITFVPLANLNCRTSGPLPPFSQVNIMSVLSHFPVPLGMLYHFSHLSSLLCAHRVDL